MSPIVTLLAPTQPSVTITPTDRRALDELSAVAMDDLTGTLDGADLLLMRARLAIAIESAGVAGTDLGIAVTVSLDRAESMVLPVSPRRRVVIDPGAAAPPSLGWDRWPRYRVLVLSANRFRILEGRRGALAERGERRPVSAGRRPDRWRMRDQRATETMDAADAALAALDRGSRLPLIVVGPSRWVRRFVDFSLHPHLLIGSVSGNRIDDPPAGIATLVAPELDRWIDRRDARVLATLEDAAATGRLRWGPAEAWHAAVTGQVAQLWVADDYAPVARLAECGTRVTVLDRTAPPVGPAVVDDLAADLLEITAALGGVAHQVPASALASTPSPVAVQLRAPLHRSWAAELSGPRKVPQPVGAA